ncbi:hypothetical protein SKAU_G00012780 [Synaphobranchus kaupii]|uniref:Chemokine interleukin-8-like domain-containing protein n=1 Tax=Synaphobranchus kaupii TaxID=118154 RepID=A0A9Q1GBG4_SYNKA|nr:hypothetical protein SKAU_G00012780 [Synaphobranchus kaupii]
MTPRPRFLFTVLAVCCISALYVFPIEGLDIGLNCRCLRTSANFINPRLFKRLEIIPLGAHCRQTEILITMKNDRTVCVDPNARWIRKFIERVIPKDKKMEQQEKEDMNATTDAPRRK